MLKFIVDKLREEYHFSRYKRARVLIKGEGHQLLDIGCGRPCESMEDGAFLRYIKYGTGLDIVDHNIEFPFKKGDITEIPFQKDSFDVVVVLEVLEHIDDIDTALLEVKRVLKPGGILVMSSPNNSMLWKLLWYVWERTFGKMWHNKHLIKYNKKQWIENLSKYFEIVRIQELYGILVIIKLRNPKKVDKIL